MLQRYFDILALINTYSLNEFEKLKEDRRGYNFISFGSALSVGHVASGFPALNLGEHWYNLYFHPSCVLTLLVSFSGSTLSFFLKLSFTLLAYTDLSSNFLIFIVSIAYSLHLVPQTTCKFLSPGIDPGTYVPGTPYIIKCSIYIYVCYVIYTHTYTQCNKYCTHNI